VANDEILAQVGQVEPDVLILFSSAPQDLPSLRALIDQLHEIGTCPKMQIVVGGGVFNRAPGLAEEIGADVWATTPVELVAAVTNKSRQRMADGQRTVGRRRKPARSAAA
jgi:methanogenic corrinoid protein MtbC1